MKVDLQDPNLFGNDAGEDEPLQILGEYFVDLPSFKQFYHPGVRLFFVRSRKGMGKSALLRHALLKCQKDRREEIAIYVKASDLISLQDGKADTPAELINLWQQRICSRISLEIGSILKVGMTDDAIRLIERSELAGFRDRNLVGSLADRLRFKIGGNEITRQALPEGDNIAILKRFQSKKEIKAWIFIDDIDATFINDERDRLIISTFFSACRNITNSVGGLNIRASVRTDVWHVIAQYDEALDKCEQYMLDLGWNQNQTGQILTNKIATNLKFNYSARQVAQSDKAIHRYVFKDPLPWNGRQASPFVPIHILSAGRPRWAAQLCRMAAGHAFRSRSEVISIRNIINIMKAYGSSRLSDIYKEHRHQCPALECIVESFSNGPSIYTTTELLHHIYINILPPGTTIVIDGKNQTDKQMVVANFLFRIGFINARNEGSGFLSFEDRPHLLSSNTNPDDGLDWEIHPSYRTVLKIYNSATKHSAVLATH